MKAPTGGGTATTIVPVATMPGGLAIDSTNAYWTEDTASGTVMAVPLAGGAATTLASGQSNPAGIAVDSTSVYWRG
jgi:DNA-binding beta-propeller fold protein YncE